MNHPEETGKLGKLVFPAVIRPYKGGCWVEFPDLAGCFTEGDTYAEAMERAETVLGAYINTMMEQGIEIPAASDARNVKCGLGCVALFEVDLDIIARDGDLGSGAVSHYYPGRQGF